MKSLYKYTAVFAAAVFCTSLLSIAREQWFGNKSSGVTTHLKNVTTLRATKAGKASKARKSAKNIEAGKATLAVPSGEPSAIPSLSAIPSGCPSPSLSIREPVKWGHHFFRIVALYNGISTE